MRIAIAADHGGFRLKNELVRLFQEERRTDPRDAVTILDLGTTSAASTDYPAHAHALAAGLLEGKYDRGILVCGTGVGMAIAANRHRGIRCVNCSDTYTAKLSRQHNDTNVLSIGERVVGPGLAWEIVTAWLDEAADSGERHVRRREMIELP